MVVEVDVVGRARTIRLGIKVSLTDRFGKERVFNARYSWEGRGDRAAFDDLWIPLGKVGVVARPLEAYPP